MKRRLLLLDIDGVIADCRHRLHYQIERDYDTFYSADEMLQDTMIVEGVDFARRLYDYDPPEVVYLTGRPERTRLYTETWMESKHRPLSAASTLYRPDGDYRPSDVVKLEALDAYLGDQYENIHKKDSRREKNKYNKLSLDEKRRLWFSEFYSEYENYYVDDDPKNVNTICRAYPELTGIVFGTERL